MIEMFVAVTLLLVLVVASVIALLKAPWWVALFCVSMLVVGLNWLLHPAQDEEAD